MNLFGGKILTGSTDGDTAAENGGAYRVPGLVFTKDGGMSRPVAGEFAPVSVPPPPPPLMFKLGLTSLCGRTATAGCCCEDEEDDDGPDLPLSAFESIIFFKFIVISDG